MKYEDDESKYGPPLVTWEIGVLICIAVVLAWMAKNWPIIEGILQ